MNFLNKETYYSSKGVYIIKNIINNKVYVGSTFLKFSCRYTTHKSRLRRNVHHSPHLQNAWNKYGEENFEFIVIEVLNNEEEIVKKEEYYINLYNSVLEGYNVTTLVEGKRFKKHSEKTKIKMSKNRCKKVCLYDLSGYYIKTYESMDSTKLDGFNPKCVSECCCGRRDSHKRYRFKYYISNYSDKLPYLNNYIKHTVLDTYTDKIYQTMVEAAKDINVNSSTIRLWIHKNYRFKKIEN